MRKKLNLKIQHPYRFPLNDNGTSAGIPTKEQATPEDYAYWDQLRAWRDDPGAFKNERHVLYEALHAIPAWYVKEKK